MADTNYWVYRIYNNSFTGRLRFVAEYLAATDDESVGTDLASGDSYLEDFLRRFYRIGPEDYAKKHPLRAQAILGALLAKHHCAERFGILSDLTPPAAQRIHHVGTLDEPDLEASGVQLWLRAEGEITGI